MKRIALLLIAGIFFTSCHNTQGTVELGHITYSTPTPYYILSIDSNNFITFDTVRGMVIHGDTSLIIRELIKLYVNEKYRADSLEDREKENYSSPAKLKL